MDIMVIDFNKDFMVAGGYYEITAEATLPTSDFELDLCEGLKCAE